MSVSNIKRTEFSYQFPAVGWLELLCHIQIQQSSVQSYERFLPVSWRALGERESSDSNARTKNKDAAWLFEIHGQQEWRGGYWWLWSFRTQIPTAWAGLSTASDETNFPIAVAKQYLKMSDDHGVAWRNRCPQTSTKGSWYTGWAGSDE